MANPPNPDGIPSPGAALLTPHPSAPHPSPHRGPTPLPSPGGGGGAVPGRGVGSEGWGGGFGDVWLSTDGRQRRWHLGRLEPSAAVQRSQGNGLNLAASLGASFVPPPR